MRAHLLHMDRAWPMHIGNPIPTPEQIDPVAIEELRAIDALNDLTLSASKSTDRTAARHFIVIAEQLEYMAKHFTDVALARAEVLDHAIFERR